MIREVNGHYPDAIFLAEAFTRPKMMKKLAKAGYQQSYTYFTWRNTKQELTEYALELAGEMGEYYRPNFFANTPDINPYYLQTSGRPGFIVRATLAATLSSVYGIYNGFEMCEAAPYPGKEEYLNSEKYELKAWDYHRPGNIREHIIKLNRIRRENPALWDFRNVVFTGAYNENIIAYAKMTPERDNCIFTMVNLDPRSRQECTYEVPPVAVRPARRRRGGGGGSAARLPVRAARQVAPDRPRSLRQVVPDLAPSRAAPGCGMTRRVRPDTDAEHPAMLSPG